MHMYIHKHVYVYLKLNHPPVYLKATQYYKSIILQFKNLVIDLYCCLH